MSSPEPNLLSKRYGALGHELYTGINGIGYGSGIMHAWFRDDLKLALPVYLDFHPEFIKKFASALKRHSQNEIHKIISDVMHAVSVHSRQFVIEVSEREEEVSDKLEQIENECKKNTEKIAKFGELFDIYNPKNFDELEEWVNKDKHFNSIHLKHSINPSTKLNAIVIRYIGF